MSNYTVKQIDIAVDSFPDALRGMLFSHDTERKVQKIGMEAGLLIDQLKTLNSVTNDAIIGLLAEKDLATEIKNSFGITETQAKEIATKVSTEIVGPIDDLKVRVLAEQYAKEKNDRLEKDNEARLAAEEKELDEAIAKETTELSSLQGEPSEYSSEAPIEIQPPKQPVLLEKVLDIAPENLPTEKDVDSFFLKLILKVATPDTEPLHPFEEKMKMAFTATPTETGNIAPAPLEAVPPLAQILPEPTNFLNAESNSSKQNLGEQAPPTQTNKPSIPSAPATGNLHHDAYREAVE